MCVSDDGSLRAAPSGYDSVLAKGRRAPDSTGDVMVCLQDSPRVLVPTGSALVDKKLQTSFNDDEVGGCWFLVVGGVRL